MMVTTEEIIDQLSQVLTIRKNRLKGDSKIQDFIQDSMDMVELIAVLSNEYGVQPDMTKLGEVSTINNIVDLVNQSTTASEPTF